MFATNPFLFPYQKKSNKKKAPRKRKSTQSIAIKSMRNKRKSHFSFPIWFDDQIFTKP